MKKNKKLKILVLRKKNDFYFLYFYYHKMMEKNCNICKENYIGYGNNAKPVSDGKCCDKCNFSVVIPARLKSILEQKEK